MKQQAIVTRESLKAMLDAADRKKRADIIGRALVRLLERQTDSERNSRATHNDNGIGFASCDADVGTRTAEGYMRYKSLLDWQLEVWMAPGRGGYPRICKYHRQLNEVATEKAAKKQAQLVA